MTHHERYLMRPLMRSMALAVLAVLFYSVEVRAGSAMAKLSSVVDGNTLNVTLRGAAVKVRMHGVVVPPADETRPILHQLNVESVAFLKKYLSDGWVYLEFPDGSPKPDADGYIPAFVYRGNDAVFLNEKLVAAGLAIVNRKEKNTFTEKWKGLQENAISAEVGMWGSFEGGGGKEIASGAAQGNYIGVPGATMKRGYSGPSYVRYWIFLYY
jgi:endonuclease YncB( thermonuclease family)